MRIDIITLFPKMFDGVFDDSIVGRAKKRGLVEINLHQLRTWATDKHSTVDDQPYGGGVGMLLKIEPIYNALQELKSAESKIILLDAGGKKYTQKKAQEFSKVDHLILLCGRYEGVDHRVREHLVDEEISIGDYVLTGGEIPAMVISDSVARLIPGVLTKEDATQFESFSEEGVVEYLQYTRPEEFNGWKVPEVLLSGNHKKIEEWRKENSLTRTRSRD